jgi:hypothetical protein
LKYKPWRRATLSKGDFENYLQNVDMVKVTWRFDKNDDEWGTILDQPYSRTTLPKKWDKA